MLKWIAGLLAGAALVVGPSSAQAAKPNKPKPTPEEIFKKLDKDNDEKLSLVEFVGKKKGAQLERAEAVFKAKDANNDGFLTLEEFKTKIKLKKNKE